MERRKFPINCFCDVAKGVFVRVAKMLCFSREVVKEGCRVFTVSCWAVSQLHERCHEFQNEKLKICDAVDLQSFQA